MGEVFPVFALEQHLSQIGEGIPVSVQESVCRVLDVDNAPTMEYDSSSSSSSVRSVKHWGQRKLLIGEIEFLTNFASSCKHVCYVGCAPGIHIPCLSSLFPSLTFHCFDPRPVVFSTDASVLFVQKEFSVDLLSEDVRKDMVLISDIRSDYEHSEDPGKVDELVSRDMALQMQWVSNIQPKASMLKFRLPWTEGTTEYLDGDLFLPVWGRPTTTECRLVCKGPVKKKMYNNKKYWEQMCYFNQKTRVQFYQHENIVDGMDHCYDCAAEDWILQQYCKRYDGYSFFFFRF